MNLRILSDLHLEHGMGRAIIDSIRAQPDDVLMLAGDAITVSALRDHRRSVVAAPGHPAALFGELVERFRRVFYVPGNHEFYGSSAADAHTYIEGMEKRWPHLTVLSAERGAVEFEGQRFLGDTLWWPQAQDDDPRLRNEMNDERCIRGMYPWVERCIRGMYPWVWMRHEAAVAMLARECRPGDVVMTHYLPHERSVAREFIGSPLNRFFMVDLSALIAEKQPALWIHGHTHKPCAYRVGQTSVLCNPCGYPGEWPNGFDPAMTATIGGRP